jgi:hypothetical protein
MTNEHCRKLAKFLELPGLARMGKYPSLRLAESARHKLDAIKSDGNPGSEELVFRSRPRCNLNGAEAVAKSRLPAMTIRLGMEVTHEDVGARGRYSPNLAGHAIEIEDVRQRERADHKIK